MANTDLKYGEVTTEHGQFIDGEPVIVFRGRDSILPEILAQYYGLCKAAGSPEHHLEATAKSLDRIVEWQDENRDQVIIPRSDAYNERVNDSNIDSSA